MNDRPLATELLELGQQRNRLFVVLVLDGSGSIDEDSFEQLRMASKAIVSTFKNAIICVIQFGTQVRTICGPTTDTETLLQSLNNMQQLIGGTNMIEAFQLATHIFLNCSNISQKRIMITITDGKPDDDPQTELNTLNQIGIQMIGIGVGNQVEEQMIVRLSSTKCAFKCDSYRQLQKQLEILAPAEPEPDACDITIEFYPTNRISKAEQPLILIAKAKNNSENDICNCKAKFKRNIYYDGCMLNFGDIAAGQTVQKQVTFDVLGTANEDNIPSALQYELSCKMGADNVERKWQGKTDLPIAWLSGDFFYENNMNILVFGRIGAGKSSLINGLINLFKTGKKLQEYLTTQRSENHVTVVHKKHELKRVLNQTGIEEVIAENVKLTFWDTVGATGENYSKLQPKDLVDGKVPDATFIVDSEEIARQRYNDPTCLDRAIHAVIGVLPITAVEDANFLQRFKQHMTQFNKETGRKPVIVLTYADAVPDPVRREADIDRILQNLPFSKSDIYLFSNYEGAAVRTNERDLILRRILLHAINNAKITAQMQPHCFPAPITPLKQLKLPLSWTNNNNNNVQPQTNLQQQSPINNSNNNPSGGFAPNPAPSIPQEDTSQKFCITVGCPNYGNIVPYFVCTFCSVPPAFKICGTSKCSSYDKDVPTPRCGYCGKEPVMPEETRHCETKGCINNGNEVKTNYCPQCGNQPESYGTPSCKSRRMTKEHSSPHTFEEKRKGQ